VNTEKRIQALIAKQAVVENARAKREADDAKRENDIEAIGVGRGMVKLINGKKAIGERFRADFIIGVTQRSMGTNQDLSVALHESLELTGLLSEEEN
jgi:hypothetical protein